MDEQERVFTKAVDITKKYDSKLTLLHVIKPPEHFVSPALTEENDEWLSGLKKNNSSYLSEDNKFAKDAYNRLKMLDTKTDLKKIDHDVRFHSDPFYAICQYVKSNHTDLIVLGSCKKHGLINLFTESTAGKIIRQIPCDVYIVNLE